MVYLRSRRNRTMKESRLQSAYINYPVSSHHPGNSFHLPDASNWRSYSDIAVQYLDGAMANLVCGGHQGAATHRLNLLNLNIDKSLHLCRHLQVPAATHRHVSRRGVLLAPAHLRQRLAQLVGRTSQSHNGSANADLVSSTARGKSRVSFASTDST
jgi:hypothetical protein